MLAAVVILSSSREILPEHRAKATAAANRAALMIAQQAALRLYKRLGIPGLLPWAH